MEISRSTIGGLQKLFLGKTIQIKQPQQHEHNLAKVSSLSLFLIYPYKVQRVEELTRLIS